jgi:hypothetical protein
MSGLLLGMVQSVCTCWFYSMVTLPPRLVSTDFGICSYQCFVSNFTPFSCILLLLLLLLLVFSYKRGLVDGYWVHKRSDLAKLFLKFAVISFVLTWLLSLFVSVLSFGYVIAITLLSITYIKKCIIIITSLSSSSLSYFYSQARPQLK